MPRSYRCILVALVGWLSLAAQPKHTATEPAKGSDHEIAAALDNLASAIQQSQKPSQHDEPCGPGGNKRTSDLCAQWKAADAAKSTAQAAWWLGIIGSLIGALTLAAAWAAAKWAKRAALHTEESAIEARRAADAAEGQVAEAKHAQRAYLAPIKESFSLNENSREFIAKFEFKNNGATPAHQATFSSTNYVRYESGRWVELANGYWPQGTIAPNSPLYLDYRFSLSEGQMRALQERRAEVIFDLHGTYSNALGEQWVYIAPMKIIADSLEDGAIYTARSRQYRADEEQGEATHQPSLDLKDGR